MCNKLILVLYFYVASVYSAPIQLQLLPMQYGIQPQLPFLRQMVPNMQSAPTMYPQQPMMIILPNMAPSAVADDRYLNLNEQEATDRLKSNTGHIDEKKDAVVIDANPKPTEPETKNALVYLPEEGRFSLGQIISYIPFLPIEINVPDTISWIGNLIAGGWFTPQSSVPNGNVKRVSTKGPMPVFVMPYPGAMPQV